MKEYSLFTKPSELCIPGHWPNEWNVRQWSGRRGFNPMSSHIKDSKNCTRCRFALQSVL